VKHYQLARLLVVLAPFSAQAAERQPLSPQQMQQAAELGIGVEKQCLQGSQPPANANSFTRTVMEWSKDPALCSCVGARVRDGLTRNVFLYNEAALRQWLKEKVSKATMECGVPIFKEKFAASCESLFAESMSGDRAQKGSSQSGKVAQNIDSMCSCAREKLGAISTKDWIEGSLQNYNAYLERKRLGSDAVKPPDSPLNTALESCAAAAEQPK
jgi:hypothetical protein